MIIYTDEMFQNINIEQKLMKVTQNKVRLSTPSIWIGLRKIEVLQIEFSM